MKKNLTRTLSIFMAIMMLMTSWVFIAPQKASAASPGNYDYKVRINTGDGCDLKGGSTPTLTLYYKENNGTGAEKTKTQNIDHSWLNTNDSDHDMYFYDVPGFVTKLKIEFTMAWTAAIKRTIQCGLTLSVKKQGTDLWARLAGEGFTEESQWGNKDVSKELCGGIDEEDKPYANMVVYESDPGVIIVPETGSTPVPIRSHLIDQYNVIIKNPTRESVTWTTSQGDDFEGGITGSWGTRGGTYEQYNFTVSSSAKGKKYDSTEITLTEGLKFKNETVEDSLKFTVKDPQYTYTFRNNGGTLTNFNDGATIKKYYWNTLTSAQFPTSGTKVGREFIGMYKTQKVDNYDITKPTAGSTSGYTGNLTTSTNVTSNETWYAAWWVKNCEVIVRNNAGQDKIKINAKYGTKVNTTYNPDWATEIATDKLAYQKAPNEGSYEFVVTGYKLVEAYDLAGNNITSSANYGNSYDEYTLVGKTIFQAEYTRVDQMPASFTVSYWYGGTRNNIQNLAYGSLPAAPRPSDYIKDPQNDYVYEFLGWVVREGNETEHIEEEGGYANVVSDFTVRKDVEYVAAYEKIPAKYTIEFKWKEDGPDGPIDMTDKKTYHWGDRVVLPVIPEFYNADGSTLRFLGWTGGTPIEYVTEGNSLGLSNISGLLNATYRAIYGDPHTSVYTINFLDREGNIIEEASGSIEHGDPVTEAAALPTYRNGINTKEYEFVKWVDQYGRDFKNIALANLTYTPVFEEHDLYPVNYYNEDVYLGTDYYREGQSIQLPTFDEPVVKNEDMLASTYTFAGWRTGEGWEMNSESEEVVIMPAAEVNLYAKYTPEYKNYTVSFYNVDSNNQKVLIRTKEDYHYGDSVIVPTETPVRASDEKYNYEFKGWDKLVETKCNGNATYTAAYRRTYVYYNVVWLDKDGAQLKNENYIWNERINTPAIAVEPPICYDSDNNVSLIEKNVHSGWTYLAPTAYTVGEDGKIVLNSWNPNARGEEFNFGDRIEGVAVLVPNFKKVTKTYTVTVYEENGTDIDYTFEAEHMTNVQSVLGTPEKGYSADDHFAFEGWYTLDDVKLEGDDFVITDAISVKPKFEIKPHSFENSDYDVTKEPTFYLTGTANVKCSCGFEKEVILPAKTDATAPEGLLYVMQNTWSTDENASGTPATTVRVGQYSQIIINAKDYSYNVDKADYEAGSGVSSISEYVTKDYVADASTITDWNTVSFVVVDEDNNPVIDEENGGEKLADVKPNLTKYVRNIDIDEVGTEEGRIQKGDNFYVYYKIVDRKGNTSYVNSCKLYYDKDLPEVSFTSDYKSATGNKHCLDATFKVTVEEGDAATVYVDDVLVTPVGGVYTVAKENIGIHQITAIDIAGNISKVNFEIVGSHSTKVYTTNPTCTVDGYTVTRCTLCSTEIGDREPIAKLGHQYGEALVIDPTCKDTGSSTKYCYRCGVSTSEEIPATNNHKYGDWKVTVEATCSSAGERIKSCITCGEIVKEVIAKNAEAHKYYRGVVVKPTCTEQGYTIHTCRYNADHYYVDSYTEPTGHVMASEWTYDPYPTCTTEGYRAKYCAKGCVDGSGNPVIVDNPDRPGEKMEETVPALGHYWIYHDKVAATATTQGYTIYKCARTGCTAEEHRDYVDFLPTYTVKFLKDDGTAYMDPFTRVQGEAVTAGEVLDPKKDADDTYTYEFVNWVKADYDAVTGKYTATDEVIELPYEVTSDITIMPQFKSRYINYSVTLNKYDEEDNVKLVAKIGYLHMGDTYHITNTVADRHDDTFNYTFIGWAANETDTPKMDVVITGDTTLYARFKKTAREYNVVLRKYNSNNSLGVLENVVAGTDVAYDNTTELFTYTVYTDATKTATTQTTKHVATPTRAYDNAAHYKFNEWPELELQEITNDRLVSPTFTPCAHTHDTEEIIQAKTTCDTTEITKYTCTCGYSETVVTKPKTQHQWSESDGTGTVTCTVCGIEKEDNNTFTVTFMDIDHTTVYKNIGGQPYGADISNRIPTITKKSDVEYTYTFAGWSKTKNGGVDTIVTVETIVKDDETYYPVFTTTPRTYTVTYAYDHDHVIKVFYNVAAHGSVEGVSTIPENNGFDDYVHYEFDRWSSNGTNIVEDTYIYPIFREIPHTMVAEEPVPATCEHGAGTEYKCSGCSYRYVKSSGKPTPHTWEIIDYKAPDLEVEGYEVRRCVNCHKVETNILPAKEYFYITVTVVDSKDVPIEGARVSLYDKGTFVVKGVTNADGKVTFRVPEKKQYTIVIDRDDFGSVTGTITVNDDGSVSLDIPPIVTHACKCTCHRTGFWPSIFRFFHKIVKLLTGEFGCCSCPDARYNK